MTQPTTTNTHPHNQHQPLVVGLTGGIASGKSTVGDFFKKLGVPVCDADQLSRDAVAAGSDGLAAVVDAFGADVLLENGEMNRSWLRDLVFQQPEQRKVLENIIHPIVRDGLQNFIVNTGAHYLVLEIPLLIESGLNTLCDRILVVDVSKDCQINRLLQRDGGSLEQANAILNAQTQRDIRLEAADDVLFNEISLEACEAKVQQLHNFYNNLTRKPR